MAPQLLQMPQNNSKLNHSSPRALLVGMAKLAIAPSMKKIVVATISLREFVWSGSALQMERHQFAPQKFALDLFLIPLAVLWVE
jgi:hypothetical protein